MYYIDSIACRSIYTCVMGAPSTMVSLRRNFAACIADEAGAPRDDLHYIHALRLCCARVTAAVLQLSTQLLLQQRVPHRAQQMWLLRLQAHIIIIFN